MLISKIYVNQQSNGESFSWRNFLKERIFVHFQKSSFSSFYPFQRWWISIILHRFFMSQIWTAIEFSPYCQQKEIFLEVMERIFGLLYEIYFWDRSLATIESELLWKCLSHVVSSHFLWNLLHILYHLTPFLIVPGVFFRGGGLYFQRKRSFFLSSSTVIILL